MTPMKRILAAALVLLTVLSLLACPASADEAEFTDVPKNAWFCTAVNWARAHGIVAGTSASKFSPEARCTRAQVVTFLWRAKGCPAPQAACEVKDVPASAWYAAAVSWAVEQGVTAGTSRTRFSPDRTVTRAEMVTFLWRANGMPAAAGRPSFSDVWDQSFYYPAVCWGSENRVVLGSGRQTFSPDAPCTRAQAVTFLFRSLYSYPTTAQLKGSLEAALAGKEGTWSVWLYQPSTEILISLNPQKIEAASLIKLFVAGGYEQCVENGTASANNRNLMDLMLSQSSNYCCDYLIDQIGKDAINRFARDNGFSDSVLSRKMGEGSGTNYTSCRDCCTALQQIVEGTYVNQTASARILQALLSQQRREKIPAGVPRGVSVANKTGELLYAQHDAAAVFAPCGTYYLCIMSTDLTNINAAKALIVSISRTVYEAIGPLPY